MERRDTEVMALEAASGEHSAFLLSAGSERVERGDRICFRAGAPEQRIVALRIVQTHRPIREPMTVDGASS
jgi:hypothetical protein